MDNCDLSILLDDLLGAYNALKHEIRRRKPYLYERWKAGGFLVDNDILSMYPAIEEVVEVLLDEAGEEAEDVVEGDNDKEDENARHNGQ